MDDGLDGLDEIDSPPCSTGIPGLDDVLSGGFSSQHLHLVEGRPGTGKTTLALQFLLAGRARGEAGLYITLSETRRELVGVCRSHGWWHPYLRDGAARREPGAGTAVDPVPPV